jgi:hypothetical protein
MISGKAFSERCTWVHDPRYPNRREFYSQLAKDGDWVFLNGDYLMSFLRKLPVLPVKRFTIIVHNTDRSFGEEELRSLLPHAYRIYAVNATISHPSLVPIPLGFRDCTLEFLSTYVPETTPRTIDIYGNFKVCNNTEKRSACMAAFADNPRVTWRVETDLPSYLHDLCRSTFVLCPDGAGLDTHRLYEALLCGATPVVLRNALTPLYETLPVCIVDAWTDPFHVPSSPPARFDVGSFLRV